MKFVELLLLAFIPWANNRFREQVKNKINKPSRCPCLMILALVFFKFFWKDWMRGSLVKLNLIFYGYKTRFLANYCVSRTLALVLISFSWENPDWHQNFQTSHLQRSFYQEEESGVGPYRSHLIPLRNFYLLAIKLFRHFDGMILFVRN